MGYYLPTLKAYEAGHKLTRAPQYTLDAHGGLSYPDGAGGHIQVAAAVVATWIEDGWLVYIPPPEEGPEGTEVPNLESTEVAELLSSRRSRLKRD